MPTQTPAPPAVQLQPPYWYHPDGLAGLDFCRQTVPPGTKDGYPQGAVGLYVDGDFWCVAALPLEPYAAMTDPEIVALLWPQWAAQATYLPPHGSPELEAHWLAEEARAAAERQEADERTISRLQMEVDRLRAGRTDVVPRKLTRHEVDSTYLMRMYEHLLAATAHPHQPGPPPAPQGICAQCGLYGSDHVHSKHYIALRAAGVPPHSTERWQAGDER